MRYLVCGVLTVGLLGLLWINAVSSYEAPHDCEWHYVDLDSKEVSVSCKLRTIDDDFTAELQQINSQVTRTLQITCSDVLFFQSSLQNHTFIHIHSLKDLSIENCKLGDIPSLAFQGLSLLKNLSLRTENTEWSAMSLKLSPGSLDPLRSLEYLDLSQNNIWEVPPRIFCQLKYLKFLNLSGNRIQEIVELSFRDEPCAPELLTLDLSHNDIVVLPSHGFRSLGQLRELHLENNELSMVADHALDGLLNLHVLNISNNKLVALPPEIFEDSKNLRRIYAVNNSLGVLAPGLFSGLKELVVLNFSWNDLTSEWFREDTFQDLNRLIVLDLSHNRLTELTPSMFKNLYALQILRLSHNEISIIGQETFGSLSNLHTLVLSHNKLHELNSQHLNGLQVLSVLDLDHNQLKNVHEKALESCKNLQKLSLNSNKLREVPKALAPLQFLRTVDLGENEVQNLEDAPWTKMTQLFGLRLINNKIGNITKETFSSLPALKILNLAHNEIESVAQNAFEKNKNLHAVRLDANHLKDINGLFSNLPSLIWLNVSDNDIEWFDYALIPKSLQWLDIHKNQIKELGNYFELESHLELETLDAGFNKITEINRKSLPDSLKLLFLNDNLVTKVEPYTFLEKENLTRVDLFANQLVNLDLNALRITPKESGNPLPEFYIGGNPFQCDCHMEWLQRIGSLDHLRQHPQVMDLDSVYCKLLFNRQKSYMPLVEADSSQFLCTYHTHCFALCHCCDFDACDCEMTCPVNCTCYHDQSWSANIVDCSSSGYRTIPDRIPMDATEVYMDGSLKLDLSSHAFIGRKNMQVLYLNNSGIHEIGNKSFNGLRSLRILHLENNILEKLNRVGFEGLVNLRELYMHNNRLKMIGNDTFMGLKSLEVLTLHGNQLVVFPVWEFPSSNPYLARLTLAQNPWSCDCDYVSRFAAWLEHNHHKVSDIEILQCTHNASVVVVGENASSHCQVPQTGSANRDLSSSSSSASDGHGPVLIVEPAILHDYLPLLLGTLGAFLIVAIFGVLSFVYRKELRVWAFSHCGLRICGKSAFEGDSERLFDAFLTYSSKDEIYVTQILAPELEQGNPPYRLCLHYRDFPVSAYLADTIVEAVESSKRTILVLSPNFLQSEWCRFEFKSALHQVLRDGRKRLIVILLGEVPIRDLDPDLRLYMKTNTWIVWGEKQFWQKLRYSMPDVEAKPRSNNLPVPASTTIHGHTHSYLHPHPHMSLVGGRGRGGRGEDLDSSGTGTYERPYATAMGKYSGHSLNSWRPPASANTLLQHHHVSVLASTSSLTCPA
ncbi:unnamed protein product [Darwinula stevensoni]|uniref:TIR domain-containing protein n=1 Tax=Darwinula stevensoni TaxID=69355 RepID=A0A7R8XA32_9CRUS|nr:unnamed protein product [Darwinula stevensoni]CAG0886331.1 unnamed protein product [Darwinula stevensoni]